MNLPGLKFTSLLIKRDRGKILIEPQIFYLKHSVRNSETLRNNSNDRKQFNNIVLVISFNQKGDNRFSKCQKSEISVSKF